MTRFLSMMGEHVIRVILFGVCSLFVLVFLFRYFEKRSLYFPFRALEATPSDAGIDYEDISILTGDGVRLAGWFVPSEQSLVTVIFLHGNGGNISHRLDKIRILNTLGADVLIVDYRGYGESQGSPSELGLYRDAEAMYDYVVRQRGISPQKVVAYGESLGGAVSVHLAAAHRIGGLIIEGSFTSVKDMARRYYPFIPSFLIQSRFNSLEKIRNAAAPILIFHSLEDEIVPFEFGKRLFGSAPEPKEFVEMRGGHNDAYAVTSDVFVTRLDSFIRAIGKAI